MVQFYFLIKNIKLKRNLLQHFTRLMTSMLKTENEEFGVSNIWLQSILLISIIWSYAGGISGIFISKNSVEVNTF